MSRNVIVYEKDPVALAFLKAFFNANKKYSVRFLDRVEDLKAALKKAPSEVVIAGAPKCLDRIAPMAKATNTIAVLSRDVPLGMRSILTHRVDHYILPPYQKYDLDCKLHLASSRHDYIDVISQEKRDLESLAELADLLSSTLDPKQVLYLIVKKLSELIPVTRCSILSVGFGDTDKAEVISTFEDKNIKSIVLDLARYPEIKKALDTREPVIVKDANVEALMKPVRKAIKELDIKSIMVIPVIFRAEVIGTLFLRTSRKRYEFNEREIGLCQKIAATAGKALNNAFLFQKLNIQKAELEKLSITDFLTGIYNIRYLYHRLESEFSECTRYKTQLSCVMMDLDHFKLINDTYGHRVGDMVLREFATIVKAQTRKSDVFARYGGEEFILVLPHTGEEGGLIECKRLGEIVRNHKFKGLKPGANITVSFGLSTFPHKKIKTLDNLISSADKALLQAKAAGRDRVAVFD